MSNSELVSKVLSPFHAARSGRGASFVGFAFVALFGMSGGMSGCISDTDCGICDPDNLVLESVTGINYANRRVHLLNEAVVSKGKYFIEDIGKCVDSEDAQNLSLATRGPDEWCKLSPLVTWQGLEFVFNNLLDPTTIELVRKNPSNPNLFEIYDWKSRIAHIEGPITRYNGDYVEQTGDLPDTMARSINLTCIENLREEKGIAFNHEVLDADPQICNGFYESGDRMLPLKMKASGTTRSYGGTTEWRGASCSAPDQGPDTCCNVCDYELSVNVAKYGVTAENGPRRTPENAIACTPGGNVYDDCADFITFVDRSAEKNRYTFEWNGSAETFRLPLSDKLRETHPDLRPPGAEPDGHPCQTDADCDDALGGDSGAACVGVTPEGVTCDGGTPGCGNRHCKAEWFVGCKSDPNLGAAYCIDRRFKDKGAGGCYVTTASFVSCELDGTCTNWGAGHRLARCDSGEYPDGNLTSAECCQESLGSEGPCDPLFQPAVVPIDRFDRDRTLPEETRDCYCGDPSGQHPACAAQIEKFCTAPWGKLQKPDGSSNEGHYTTRFVSRPGGVIYDPALKGVLYLPADRGHEPRSMVESCADLAANPDLIEGRNIQDGWRMHDNAFFENYENFDRGMCSGSEYKVVFATEGQEIRDKVGNKLEGKNLEFNFETPEFHVVPGTGFPTDNLRIGGCDDFEIRVSNRYDLDPQNLKKIQLVQISRIGGTDSLGESCTTSFAPECWKEDHVIAGGLDCTDEPSDQSPETPPCLTVDVTLHREGAIRVLIDSIRFGAQLFNLSKDPNSNFDEFGRAVTGRYRMVIPGLDNVERFEDLKLDGTNTAHLDAYNAAFHDVCGMPLITKGGKDYKDFYYDFTIDAPKCKEDPDGDGIPLSCDNARYHYNPDQDDQDQDGIGDVADLCALTPGGSAAASADSDKDGIGNDCDNCRQTIDKYNLAAAMVDDPRMWVRNIPFQIDSDQDGIGDVCDNCVPFANCGPFGPSSPHRVGVPVPFENKSVCQTDTDSDMIGDACIDSDTNAPYNLPFAAGPIGFGQTDDFDQDGIINLEDVCPRQPVAIVNANIDERTVCVDNSDCDNGANCATTPANDGNRYCNHLDSDNDGVGDICDTCPYRANPMQVTDTGMQIDDEDGDFVGNPCETHSSCYIRKDPRPYAFMHVAVEGQCCVTTYPGDGEYKQLSDGSWDCIGLCDPDGFPITVGCTNEANPEEDTPDGSKCRKLPSTVASLPGVVMLAPGCDQALADANMCAPQGENDPDCPLEMANRRLTLLDVEDEHELWTKMCFLPQWDQDFDGVGDACDLCPFVFDPFNSPYVDQKTGKLWDNVGKYCAGDYAPDAVCAAKEAAGGGTGTDGDTGTTGEEETTG